MQCHHLDAVVAQRRHDRVDWSCMSTRSHHDIHATSTLRHRDPAAKAERRGRIHARACDADIVPLNAHLGDVRLVGDLLTQSGQTWWYSAGPWARDHATDPPTIASANTTCTNPVRLRRPSGDADFPAPVRGNPASQTCPRDRWPDKMAKFRGFLRPLGWRCSCGCWQRVPHVPSNCTLHRVDTGSRSGRRTVLQGAVLASCRELR